MPEIFLIIRIIQGNIIIILHRSSRKVPFTLVTFQSVSNLFERFPKNIQISKFIKILPVGAELFNADGRKVGRTGRHTDSNSRFRNFAKAPEKSNIAFIIRWMETDINME